MLIIKIIYRTLKIPFLISIIGILAISTTSCNGSQMASVDRPIEMTSLDQMPPEVQNATIAVQQAYQFAFSNPDVLKMIPCYCGCGSIGHKSNYDCYIEGTGTDGKTVIDNHGLGCSICVDITQDIMRLLTQGKSVPKINAYIDKTYSKYGPSNMQ